MTDTKHEKKEKVAEAAAVEKATKTTEEAAKNRGKRAVRSRWARLTVPLTIGAIVLVILIAVGAIILNRQEPVPDGYFVSDDTKLVMGVPAGISALESNKEYAPEMNYLVYYYDGNKITNARIYFEYDDDAEAKEANDHITLENKPWAASKRLNGRYIVFEAKPDQYRDLTTERVRENIGDNSSL